MDRSPPTGFFGHGFWPVSGFHRSWSVFFLLLVAGFLGLAGPAFAGLSSGEVLIATGIYNVLEVELDSHHGEGSLFALLRFSDVGGDYYSLCYSLDGGKSWSHHMDSVLIGADASLAVIGNYCYVAYLSTDGQRVWARRYLVTTGQRDLNYHYPIKDSLGANVYKEIALVSSQDSLVFNDLYCFVLAFNGAIFWFIADEDGGAGVPGWELQPTVVTNAVQGLDATWIVNMWSAYVSYLSESGDGDSAPDRVSLLRADTSSPHVFVEDLGNDPWDSPMSTTRVGAYGLDAMVVYQAFDGDRMGVRFKVTYDGWDSWLHGWVARPNGAEVAYRSPDVTLRRGQGIAVSYLERTTADLTGHLLFEHRAYAQGSPWSAPEPFASEVGSLPVSTAVEQLQLPDDSVYGVAWVNADGQAYFDIPLLIFADGFETGNTGAWSPAVP